MKCDEAMRRIDSDPGSDDALLEAHLQTCVECSLLAGENLGRLASAAESGRDEGYEMDALQASLGATLARERGPMAWLRSRPTGLRYVIATLPCVIVPLAFALAQPRIDLSFYPMARLAGVAILLLALIALALHSRLRPAYRAPASLASLAAVTAVATIALVVDATAPAAHAALPASLEGAGADLLARALGCFLTGTGIAIPALVLIGLVDRWSDQRRLSVLLLPLLAGLGGYLALHLHCHLVAPAHLVVGHLSVVIVLLGIGACIIAARARRTR